MIHPNLINAAVLQTYGLSSQQGHFDAMSLAPNFDLAVTQQQATEIAARLAEWSTNEIDLGDQGDLIIQTPYSPSKENMRHHRDFIDPTMQSVAQKTSISQVTNVLNGADAGLTVEDPDQPVDQPDAEGHQEEPEDAPGTSADQPKLVEVKKESDSVKQEDDHPDDDLMEMI